MRRIRERDVEGALRAEFELYERFVKAVEDEDHYERSFAAWRGEMAELGRTFSRPMPAPAGHGIGFVLHNGIILGHTEVLLRLLEGRDRATVAARIYLLDGSCPDLARRAQALGVPVEAYSPGERGPSVLGAFEWLRAALARNGDATAVWVSAPVLATFALAMRIAPVQVFWSLRYHPVRLPEIDGYITYGSWAETERVFHGQRWAVCPVPLALERRQVAAAEVAAVRARFPQRVVLGTLARAEKIASPEFLDSVARVLARHPECGFVWTGRSRHAGIDAFLRERGVAERCHFVGWVDTALYGAALDLFLESFPLGCGITGYQAMAAGVALLSFLDADTVFGMRYGKEAMDRAGTHSAVTRELLDEYPVLCARSPDEYVELASRLVADRAFRAEWAAREARFFDEEAGAAARYAARFFDTVRAVAEEACSAS